MAAKDILIRRIGSVYGVPDLSSGDDLRIGADGRAAAAGPDQDKGNCVCIDARALTLSPGWIDIHTHVYEGVTDIALDPDLIGPVQGVSVLADAGSSGHVTFPGFRKYIIDTKPYGIFAFLNFGSIGLIRTNVIGDFETDDCIQSDETLRCIEANRDVIRGVKLRACRVTLKGRGIEIVHRASAAAREADLPLMVHIGEPGPPLGEILNSLRAGDIVTHCFHGKPGCIIGDNGRIIPEAYAARERGVLFDIGHGGASFDIHVGRRAVLDGGFRPHLISTDLHSHNINGPVHSLALTMSKMLACGLDEGEILEGVTAAPARSLGIEDYQSGILGREARFTLFETVENEKTFSDAGGNGIQPSRLFRPRFTILGSEVISCG